MGIGDKDKKALCDSIRLLQIGMGWFPERPGGLNRYYYGLFQQLGNHPEIEVRGVVAGTQNVLQQSSGKIVPFAEPNRFLPARLLASRKHIRKMLQEFRPHVVVSHFALYTFPSLSALKQYPLVVYFHGPWASESAVEGERSTVEVWKMRLERAVYRRGVRLIVLSKAFMELLVTQYGVEPERVHILPGGICTDDYAALTLTKLQARQQLNWPLERPIVLAVRRLQRRMGLEMLLRAVAGLKPHFPDLLVLIAGNGHLKAHLEMLIRELGLEGNARLLGFLPDNLLPLAYRAADFTVVPTVALEGFGLITIESLATGTPVLVTPVGGLPEVIRPFQPEWVTEAATEAALADRLRAILSGSIPQPSPEACKEYVRRHFDWSVVVPRFLQICEEVRQVKE